MLYRTLPPIKTFQTLIMDLVSVLYDCILHIFCGILLIFILLWPYCQIQEGPSWSWSYRSWIYNYLCNQCVSPLKLQDERTRAKTSWLEIRTLCSSGVTCPSVDCYFSALALTISKFSTKPTSSLSHRNVSCSRHDKAEKVNLALNTNYALLYCEHRNRSIRRFITTQDQS